MEPIKVGLYKHFKGNHYRVSYIARHSESLEDMVVYKALYGDMGVWVRPLTMWNDIVEFLGEKVKRFEYIGE